jgi:hypothetical protein
MLGARACGLALGLVLAQWYCGAADAAILQLLNAGDGVCGREQVVAVRLLGAERVASFGAEVVYDRSQYRFLGSRRTAATRNWLLAGSNELGPGVISIGGTAFLAPPVSGDASVLELRFVSACDGPECRSALTLRNPSAGTSDALLASGEVACDPDGLAEGERDDPPGAACRDITVVLEPNRPFGSLRVQELDAGSSDDRGPVRLSASRTAFTCEDIGENTVTLRVADGIGQSSLCTAIVTVVDGRDPLDVSCRNIVLNLDANGEASMLPVALGTALFDCDVVLSVSQSEFTCDDLGRNTTILTATNQGVPEQCSATVTVRDPLGACAAPPASYRLTALVSGEGDVVVEPAPNAGNSVSYAAGTIVTVRQMPRPGWEFAGWRGDVSDGERGVDSVTVAMTRARDIEAVFQETAVTPEEQACGCLPGSPVKRLGDWIAALASLTVMAGASLVQRR